MPKQIIGPELEQKPRVRQTQDALLDYLVHHAAKLVPVSFNKVIIQEADGSFVCRAAFTGYPAGLSGLSNQDPVPEAAWSIYQEALAHDQPLVMHQTDPSFSSEERKALGLDHACRLWLLPIRANSEPLGLLVLGEDSCFLRTGYVMRGMEMLQGIADRVALT
ncbi:MAG: GAF domain-containing protein, partial [Anaerolineaceae bacterium]|nr:GAF domain-containing protein [Anaerolineaceae bacterium]